MALLIAVKGWDPAPWAERMKERLPEHEIRTWPDAMGDPRDIEYVLTWKAPGELLNSLPGLKVIFSLGAGVDHILKGQSLPDVPVVRVVDPDLTARMTEWITLQVLLHHRKLPTYAEQQTKRLWKEHTQPGTAEVRVGILGLGVLGKDAAEMLVRFGFNVAGWARSKKAIEGVECFAGAAELDAFLARTDILVNLLPLTPDTTHLIDHAFLSKLARDGVHGGPIFINAGRGATQVEGDIVRALTDGTLKAASLDVFETEPLASDSPLWNLPNAIITPHIAADSDPAALSTYVAGQIRAFEAGKPLENLVDLKAGY
ncbi:glyoxylate/hydroxypyruvate reductase A [Stappia sp. GBMRC 2046]|uniref:Glyoxylate/hydroxypyruvate reductase A n=1 Tax=Stappia sediminis TaxID=2692190 RepID=A0A7X3LWM4_9HYPH|nr:glyoxylate/hydroxypyruvate reductase A [Stappia sediminis]MXN66411.1 glyoxylate/hydroxypyruvate reductase A [Stappia sediminis]